MINPLYDLRSICPDCNKDLDLIDKFDRISNKLIYPVYKFQCKECNKELYIRWVKVSDNEVAPVICDVAEVKDFENDIVNFSRMNKRLLQPM